MNVVWTEQSLARLIEIEAFVARDNPGAKKRLIDRLVDRAHALASHPERGRRLRELPDAGLRELLVGNYRIVYRRKVDGIEVLTVFEGHRLLRASEIDD